MLSIKHLRTLRHVSILIDHHQGVRRSLVQHTSPHRMSRTHNKRYAATSPRSTFKNFKLSDFFKIQVTLTRHRQTP